MNTSTENNCIFFLDNDPTLAAQALFDDDLRVTILYLAIVASRVLKNLLPDVDWKKEGYVIYDTSSDPPFDTDVRWLESTPSIWRWSRDYFKAMLAEYEFRFDKKHPSHVILDLFESEAELDKDSIDEFSPPSIKSIDSKYHVDANFRTYKVYLEKSKGKGKFKISPLNTCRHFYKAKYDDETNESNYTKRTVPTFIRPPVPVEELRVPVAGRTTWVPRPTTLGRF